MPYVRRRSQFSVAMTIRGGSNAREYDAPDGSGGPVDELQEAIATSVAMAAAFRLRLDKASNSFIALYLIRSTIRWVPSPTWE